jgi:hypothetical protein
VTRGSRKAKRRDAIHVKICTNVTREEMMKVCMAYKIRADPPETRCPFPFFLPPRTLAPVSPAESLAHEAT